MKKLLTLVLTLMMVLALAACGDKTDPAPSGSNDPAASQQEPADNEQEETNQTAQWPTEGLGALIPEPEFEYEIRVDSAERFLIRVDENVVGLDEIRAYTEAIKNAGFDLVDWDEYDENNNIYNFRTKNENGEWIDVTNTTITVFSADY